jgi:hypothetical protein
MKDLFLVIYVCERQIFVWDGERRNSRQSVSAGHGAAVRTAT